MKKTKQAEFTKWFGPLLDALRELGGSGKPKEVVNQIAIAKKNIMNSQKVYKSGDSYATMLHEKSSGLVMTNFDEYLTDEDVADILVYVLGNTR